uniref:hypothetical protein n=1 Tax=Herbaspirillum lusitanum TaxID=213312 RepID=UPI00058FFDE4
MVGTSAWSLAGQTLTASDTLLVKVSDAAGNDGAVSSQAYVYDTVATVPTVDTLQTGSLTPTLTGHATLAAGETLTVTVGGATYDVVPVAGSWSLDLATAVPASGALGLVLNSRYQVTATVTDLAGNVASDASANELTVGTIAQALPPSTTPELPPPLPTQTQLPQLPSTTGLGDTPPVPPITAASVLTSVPMSPGGWGSGLGQGASLPDAAALPDIVDVATGRADLIGNDRVLISNTPLPDLSASSGARISY